MSEALGEPEGFGWRENLRDGRTVAIRLGRPADTAGVEAMHERCSPESRYQRYFTPMNEWREDNLRRISGGHRGATLVVTDVHDDVIALGNVFPSGPGDVDAAEIAVIVDDAVTGTKGQDGTVTMKRAPRTAEEIQKIQGLVAAAFRQLAAGLERDREAHGILGPGRQFGERRGARVLPVAFHGPGDVPREPLGQAAGDGLPVGLEEHPGHRDLHDRDRQHDDQQRAAKQACRQQALDELHP